MLDPSWKTWHMLIPRLLLSWATGPYFFQAEKKNICVLFRQQNDVFNWFQWEQKHVLTGETEVSGAQPPIFSCEVPPFLPFQVITEVLREQLQGRLELTTSWCGFCCSEKHAVFGVLRRNVPSGYVKTAIENDNRNSGFSQL